MTTVERKSEPYQLQAKRLTLPFVVRSACPECGKKHKQDLSVDGLSYAALDKPFDFGFCCDKCDHEWKVPLQLQITLSLV
jgi:hypothetical protein